MVVPARNEAPFLAGTLASLAATRETDLEVELVVVDDGSDDRDLGIEGFEAAGCSLRVIRLEEHAGVAAARNAGGFAASGDVLVMTDAHVRFVRGWDRIVTERLADDRTVLAGTVTSTYPPFRGYGCSLVIPWMGTRWNPAVPEGDRLVHVASSAATVLGRDLFHRVGGYDAGMVHYGGAEPEFSVRCWLSGARVVSVPELEVLHRFKPRKERVAFLKQVRPALVHNSLRFGLLYLNDAASLQMLRYYAMLFPDHAERALADIDRSDVWRRRAMLRRTLPRDFEWLKATLGLTDHAGGPIP